MNLGQREHDLCGECCEEITAGKGNGSEGDGGAISSFEFDS